MFTAEYTSIDKWISKTGDYTHAHIHIQRGVNGCGEPEKVILNILRRFCHENGKKQNVEYNCTI